MINQFGNKTWKDTCKGKSQTNYTSDSFGHWLILIISSENYGLELSLNQKLTQKQFIVKLISNLKPKIFSYKTKS